MSKRLNPAQPLARDFGANGRAQRSRPSRLVQIGTGSLALGRETITAQRYQDCHLFDRMASKAQISESQMQAAAEVLRRYQHARLEPRVTAAYEPRG